MNNKLHKAMPTIFSFGCVIGVVATGVTSAKAAVEAYKALQKKQNNSNDELTRNEIVRITAKYYICPMLVASSTILLAILSNIFNKKQTMSIASAYAILNNASKSVKKKEKSVEIDSKQKETSNTQDDKCLFYEEHYGKVFRCSIEKVLLAEYHLNRDFILKGSATLNDFFDYLGLNKIDSGRRTLYNPLVWDSGIAHELYGHEWIDFVHEKVILEDGLECYAIKMPFPPVCYS